MSDPVVLDPASGSRMFYFDREDERVLFGDIRSEEHVLCDGRALSISPEVLMDFRELPFDDGAFKVVVFDPPHLSNVGEKAWMGKKYGRLGPNWRDDLRAGFDAVDVDACLDRSLGAAGHGSYRLSRPPGTVVQRGHAYHVPPRPR